MIYDLSNTYDIPRFEEAARRFLKAGAVVCLSRKQQQRTLRQNSYLHLILGWFACETGYTIDEVKQDFFKRKCNKELFEEEFEGRRGTITRLRSTSDLSTSEMTTAIERFRNYAASEAGIYLPAPNENEALLYCEKEMERNKDYN